jgi:hypothetical protein
MTVELKNGVVSTEQVGDLHKLHCLVIAMQHSLKLMEVDVNQPAFFSSPTNPSWASM